MPEIPACDCTIRNHGRVLEFCPMHKAAPEMLRTLKNLVAFIAERPAGIHPYAQNTWLEAREAIAQARGPSPPGRREEVGT